MDGWSHSDLALGRVPLPSGASAGRVSSIPAMANDLSILMPVFNEYSTVDAAIRDGLDADLPVARRELVVDDGSTVGTRELLGEPEIAARVLRAGERIHEVPISYKARGRDAGKKLTAFDGVRVLRTLVRCRVM